MKYKSRILLYILYLLIGYDVLTILCDSFDGDATPLPERYRTEFPWYLPLLVSLLFILFITTMFMSAPRLARLSAAFFSLGMIARATQQWLFYQHSLLNPLVGILSVACFVISLVCLRQHLKQVSESGEQTMSNRTS